MSISCIVLDDEELSIKYLLTLIAKIPFLHVAGQFTDPTEAIAFLEQNPVDLVFLDIEMPNYSIDGIDFIKIAGDRQGYIFTTAYPKYALESYDYNAIDFLTKPISFERLSKAVQKAKILIRSNQGEDGSEELFSYVRIDNKYQRIDLDAIWWIKSERNYITIFTEKEQINFKLSMSELEAQLPKKRFVRVHKSFIVALNKVDWFDTAQVWIKWPSEPKAIPVGDTYRKALLEAIAQRRMK